MLLPPLTEEEQWLHDRPETLIRKLRLEKMRTATLRAELDELTRRRKEVTLVEVSVPRWVAEDMVRERLRPREKRRGKRKGKRGGR